jgi:hypothetical protein
MDDVTPAHGWHPYFDPPPMPPTEDHRPPPPKHPQPKDRGPSTLYQPNLIAAMIASVGMCVGSLGPWLTFLMFDRSNTDGDGMVTLGLGIASAVALFSVLNLGRNGDKVRLIRALGRGATLAGVAAFLIGLSDAIEVSSRKVEFFGRTIGPQIGWGLWLVLIMSAVLAVTAGIVVNQAPRAVRDDA